MEHSGRKAEGESKMCLQGLDYLSFFSIFTFFPASRAKVPIFVAVNPRQIPGLDRMDGEEFKEVSGKDVL